MNKADLTNRLIELKSDGKEYHSLMGRIKQAKKIIENRQNCTGLAWKVTNGEGVTHFLAGTIHFATRAMVKSPLMKKVIENSAEVITELGAEKDVESLIAQRQEEIEKEVPQAFHHCMEAELHDLARKSGISIGQLETIQEQIECSIRAQALQKTEQKKYQESLPMNSKNRGLREKIIMYPEFHLLYESMEAWQLGDEEAFQTGLNNSFHKYDHIEVNERNTNWLNGKDGHPGLLEKLTSSAHSVCVAVGTAHLFGDRGLIKAFQQHHGLSVERMHSAA